MQVYQWCEAFQLEMPVSGLPLIFAEVRVGRQTISAYLMILARVTWGAACCAPQRSTVLVQWFPAKSSIARQTKTAP